MVERIEPQVRDVVDIFGNRAQVAELYVEQSGTTFLRAEDLDGNVLRFPARLADVLFCAVDDEMVAAADVEVEPVAGLWYDGEEAIDTAEPRNIWAAQEVI